MGSPDLQLVQTGYDHPDATTLIAEVQAEYVVRYGGPDSSPVDPRAFDPPVGGFFVGYLGEVAVGTGAWRRSDVEVLGAATTAEIKRMYVVPWARGAGHARAMLAHLEATATASGVAAMVLETGTAQPEAIALYLSAGYTAVPGFGHHRDAPQSRCYAKLLTPGRPTS